MGKYLGEADIRYLKTQILISRLPKCGQCDKWMKQSCPKEKGVMQGGPSASEVSCDEFIQNKLYENLEEK